MSPPSKENTQVSFWSTQDKEREKIKCPFHKIPFSPAVGQKQDKNTDKKLK